MKQFGGWRRACVVSLVCIASVGALAAQTFTSLVDFDGANGASPDGNSLVQGVDGGLYGTTGSGGVGTCFNSFGCGTIFKLKANSLSTIYNFSCGRTNCSDGSFPGGSLTLSPDGTLYGVAAGGSFFCGQSVGCGTIFKVTPEGALSALHIFRDEAEGYLPEGGLTLSADGNFYGTVGLGGATGCGSAGGCGAAFVMTPEGIVTVLHKFVGTDGAYPLGGLVQSSRGGEFYGTTSGVGVSDGSIFRMSSDGVLRALQLTTADGATFPGAGLIQGTDGNFYGTTEYTADDFTGGGTVLKIAPSGALTVLYTFCLQLGCPDGLRPQGTLVQATDGNLYGMTRYGGNYPCKAQGNQGCGTIFQITLAGVLTTLHSFNGDDGASPFNGLVQATNGALYGVTDAGGTGTCLYSPGCGTIFSLDMGLGPFVGLVSTSGRVGHTAGILGQGFTGTTGVSFNGVPASFTVRSDTFLLTTVPAGATTGAVTVTTPSGTLTSNAIFRVIP